LFALQGEKMAALEATEAKDRAAFESFKKSHCTFAVRVTNEIDQLFEAREKSPQPLQKDRGDILRALLAANGGKLPEKIARQKMRMSKQAFTNLLAVVDEIESIPLRTDKRQRLLVLK